MIHAVHKNGVFRPVDPGELPDRCEVEVEIRQVKEGSKVLTLDNVYDLGRRHETGGHNLAARHNEHQP